MNTTARLLGLALVASGCTPAARDVAIRAADVVCVGITLAADPTLTPICATLEEIALAMNANDKTISNPAPVPPDGVPPPEADIHKRIMVTRGTK